MSWQNVDNVLVPAPIIRDTFIPLYNLAVDSLVDVWMHGMVGLDFMIHNRGATGIVVSINNQIVKNVPAGASFEWNDQNIGLVFINGTGAFLYDALITGVSHKKLKRMKVL